MQHLRHLIQRQEIKFAQHTRPLQSYMSNFRQKPTRAPTHHILKRFPRKQSALRNGSQRRPLRNWKIFLFSCQKFRMEDTPRPEPRLIKLAIPIRFYTAWNLLEMIGLELTTSSMS
jgi:hypothetical protein